MFFSFSYLPRHLLWHWYVAGGVGCSLMWHPNSRCIGVSNPWTCRGRWINLPVILIRIVKRKRSKEKKRYLRRDTLVSGPCPHRVWGFGRCCIKSPCCHCDIPRAGGVGHLSMGCRAKSWEVSQRGSAKFKVQVQRTSPKLGRHIKVDEVHTPPLSCDVTFLWQGT